VIALAVLVFFELVFLGHVPFERDIHALFWGQCASFARMVEAGAWPVWNPWLGFGQPLLANPGAQVLYPLTWLNLAMRPEDYAAVYVVVHLAWAGLGVLALARALRFEWGAATVGAAVYMLSGPLLSSVSLWQHFAAAAWMPWVLAAARRAVEDPRPHRVGLWVLAQSAQLLSGSLDLVVLTAVPQAVLIASVLWRARRDGRSANRFAAVPIAVALTFGVTAAQWLPAIDLLRSASRSQLSEQDRVLWSVPPPLLGQVVVPVLGQDLPLRADVRAALYEGREPLLASLYLGLPATLLAAASLLSRRRRLALAAFLLGFAALLVALGRFGFAYSWLVGAVPPLALFRYPVKAILLAALAMALLAATGFEAWREGRVSRHGALLVAGLAALGGAGGLAVVRWLRSEGLRFLSAPPGAPPPRGALEGALLLATWSSALALVVAGAAALSTAGRHRWAGVAAAAAVLDLLAAHRSLNPSIPRAQVQETPAVIELLRADGVGRLCAFHHQLSLARGKPVAAPPLSGLPRTWGFIALAQQYPEATARWGIRGSFDADIVHLDSRERETLRSLLIALRGDPPGLGRLLQLCAVTHVLSHHREGLDDLTPLAAVETSSAGTAYVYRVNDPLPRAFLVTGVRVARGADVPLMLLDSAFDPRTSAIVPEGDEWPQRPFSGRVDIREERADRLTVSVSTDVPGLLVVVDGFDAGWRASVDGRSVAVERTNLDFRGVRVPAGAHDVRLVYRPPRVLAGLLVTSVSLVIGMALLWLAARPVRGVAPVVEPRPSLRTG
jgi:membrane protein YfhO